jgi:hypothetical protein
MNAPAERPEPKLRLYNQAVRDVELANRLIFEAPDFCNLVSPAPSCGAIPDGFAIAFSTVLINIERETYPTENGHALGKTAIERIGHAAAVEWDFRPEGCRVVERGHQWCRCAAVGSYKHFDNRVVPIGDIGEIDLRDGSDLYEKIVREARENNRPYEARLNIMRTHVVSLAMTRAKLRALRGFGLRSSYTLGELALPFVVVRLMLTGQSSDPVLRRQFAVMVASAALRSGRAAYGEDVPAFESSQVSTAERGVGHRVQAGSGGDPCDGNPGGRPGDASGGSSKPGAGTSAPRNASIFCEYCGTDGAVEIRGKAGPVLRCNAPSCVELGNKDAARDPQSSQSGPKPAARTQPPATPSNVPPTRSGAAGARGSSKPKPKLSGFKIPGGEEKDRPIEEATLGAVTYWMQHIDRKFRRGEVEDRYLEFNTKLLAALKAELDRRDGEDPIPY